MSRIRILYPLVLLLLIHGAPARAASCWSACTDGRRSFAHCLYECGPGKGCWEGCGKEHRYPYCKSVCSPDEDGCYDVCVKEHPQPLCRADCRGGAGESTLSGSASGTKSPPVTERLSPGTDANIPVDDPAPPLPSVAGPGN